MQNPFEKGPERILTKEEIMSTISYIASRRSPENPKLIRELSDEQGLYLLEAAIEGDEPGETIQYEYMRKGRYPNKNEASETAIHEVYYENDIPVGGEKIGVYDYETGEWKRIRN